MTDTGSHTLTYTGYYDGERRPVRGVVPAEDLVSIHVNGEPLVSLACTPTHLEELALGFLFNEGLIAGPGAIEAVDLCDQKRRVDVWLHQDIEIPQLRTITSGCSGGATFKDVTGLYYHVQSDLHVTPQQVTQLIQDFEQTTALYRRTGGVHGAALAEGEQILYLVEDIGRHNTLDKIAGMCLRSSCSTQGRILLTSGRASSEMVNKVARMGVPIVISRTSPTSLAVQLARGWDVTLIGYTRRRSFRVYAGEERVVNQAG